MWENFPIPDLLRMEFIPKELNSSADLLFRWYQGKKEKEKKEMINSIRPTQSELQKLHANENWGVDKLIWLCKKKGWMASKGEMREVIMKYLVCQWFELPKNRLEFREGVRYKSACSSHQHGHNWTVASWQDGSQVYSMYHRSSV